MALLPPTNSALISDADIVPERYPTLTFSQVGIENEFLTDWDFQGSDDFEIISKSGESSPMPTTDIGNNKFSIGERTISQLTDYILLETPYETQ